jgi:protein-tyrosine phosphatase
VAEPFEVLFVCIGNVCRSPVAERLLQMRLDQQGVAESFAVSSAGVRGLVGLPMTPESASELRRREVPAEEFEARRLTESLARRAALVLTATADVRRSVLEEAPAALRRTFTWREFAALVHDVSAGSSADLVAYAASHRHEANGLDLDTEDPIGQSPEVYARVAAEIDGAVSAIAEALARSAAA